MKKYFTFLLPILFATCTNAQITSVSVDEFEKQLIATKGAQLIDVRTPAEFAKYRIQSAQNMDFKAADFAEQIQKLDKNQPVLIYCLASPRSKAALAIFEQAGFTTVYELAGGINAWSKAGKPIDQDLSGKGEMTVADYNKITQAKGYVLVDFYAPWCAPCRKMLPIVNELFEKYSDQFQLLTVDFDQNRLLAKEKNITSVPYLIIFKNGKKVWEKSGEATQEEIMKVLGIRK
ncbi:MAG: thioredoxin domain-containing protein [Bacteroidetes bacterium]|nr:thioredoxin domain-containing protein [Bacteroidota bacterium]